ncbi:MAG: urease accessory protein UreD [Methylophilus sp.]|nr:urease accessory protein UreD [Methylophilus sp.]
MDDAQIKNEVTQTLGTPPQHWVAHLALRFAHQHVAHQQDAYKVARSFLAFKKHHGPLVLQKSLHPEGPEICHGVVVHPPGGVAGGDALTLETTLESSAHALLTTPGAGKWYKANGQSASQHLAFSLAENTCFEWLPQENILFDGAQVNFSARIDLAEGAKYAGWDIICFGRQAQQERWKTGYMHQDLAIYRQNKLIWRELGKISPNSRCMQSIVGLAGSPVSASFTVVAGAVPAEIVEACKAVQPNVALDLQAKYGVTALPEVFSVRYVGQSAQSAKQYFEQLWQILRPWYGGREAIRPRIWNT